MTHAMAITLKDTGVDLLGDKLYIEDRGYHVEKVVWSPRIGITVGTEQHWRCYADGHVCVSGKRLRDSARDVKSQLPAEVARPRKSARFCD